MKLDTIFGRDVGVRAKGAVDLTGDHPHVDLSSARFAALPVPGFVTNWVEDLINDQLDDVIVAFPMQVAFSEDEATLEAAP